MKLTKFSLMNPNEVDKFEELQRTKFRPNSFGQAKSTAKTLKEGLEKNLKKLGKEEKSMLIRLDNLLKGNSAFDGFTSIDYLKDILSKDTPGNRIAIARLMKDTNKGIADIDEQITFPFTDGSKPTEKYAKLRLIEEFGVASEDFMLLPDAGSNRLLLDEKGKKLSFAKDLNTKSKVRSIDAISDLKNVVIIWCMKYKGGTAAVGGSGQKDQGTTEGAHMAEIVERLHASGNSLVYNKKPVFFANMVYGGQFNDPKRIFENEMSFKSDKDCVRSFNISIDAVKNVMDLLDNPKTNLDSAVDTLYNKYGYDIEYTGKLKPQEITRLKKYV
jgi:hypothetical protein